MKIEFIVERAEQLKKLEDAMKKMPCVLIPDNNTLEVHLGIGEKTVIIAPRYDHMPISEVRGRINGEFHLDYNPQNPDNSSLLLQTKDYAYLISLRRGKR